MITVRAMQKADVTNVHRIETLSFRTPWSKAALMSELSNRVAPYLVAEYAGKIVGYLGRWVLFDECHITNLAVRAAARRQGLGTALLCSLLRYMSNLGAAWADLEVRVSNENAQRLYAKAGFVTLGKRKKYYEDNGEDALLMVCEQMPPVDPDFEEEPVLPEETA